MADKILVVDDERDIRYILETQLTKAGYEVYGAESAGEALEKFQKQDIGVFILDLKLPGMDGLELCKRIRKEQPLSCIYAMTAYSSVYNLTGCREVGFDDYFKKPFEIDIVVAMIKESFAKLKRWKQNSK